MYKLFLADRWNFRHHNKTELLRRIRTQGREQRFPAETVRGTRTSFSSPGSVSGSRDHLVVWRHGESGPSQPSHANHSQTCKHVSLSCHLLHSLLNASIASRLLRGEIPRKIPPKAHPTASPQRRNTVPMSSSSSLSASLSRRFRAVGVASSEPTVAASQGIASISWRISAPRTTATLPWRSD